MTTFGVFGKGLLKNNALLRQHLQSYTGKTVTIQRIYPLISAMISPIEQYEAMLGWGRKKSYRRASRFAKQHNLTMLTLEDGFLRSLSSGKHSRFACSMIIDPIGIYFDAKNPSLLEQLIIQQSLSEVGRQQSQALMERIVEERLSKYNPTAKSGTLRHLAINLADENILLIDQVAGDQSIAGAGANPQSFAYMLQTAQQCHPNAKIWIKAHPAGKEGYLTELKLPSDIHIIREAVNPIELLECMDEVYTVSSHMGFEALMLAKTVHCFGVPWYAGWGLTNDNNAPSDLYQQVYQRRGKLKSASLIELFQACYQQYSHYANPATGKACQIHEAIDWLVTNRDWRNRLPNEMTVFEVSRWKYSFVKAFLASSGTKLKFIPKAKTKSLLPSKVFLNQKKSSFLVWGFAKKQTLATDIQSYEDTQQLSSSTTAHQTGDIWCMEDGFIRSNGLGANLIEPLSVVIDQRGIYYNATEPSDLEQLLAQQNALTQPQLTRTQALIGRLLQQQVSKYNVGSHQPLIIEDKHDNDSREKILVVGQVEDDMSVRLCASDITTNLGLLQRVRQDKPNAYIIYKPHPDVQAGLRTGKISDEEMQRYANQVVLDISMPACLAAVDSVHTISSLTGFEALLRGLVVTCYGLPFYAGWGLTQDQAQNITATQTQHRRQRLEALTLEQLVYCALIQYPMYHLPEQYGLAQVEDVIDLLYNLNQQNQPNRMSLKTIKVIMVGQLKQQFMKARHQFFDVLLHSDKRQNRHK